MAINNRCNGGAVYIPQRECGDCGDYGEDIAALQQSVRTLDSEKQDNLVAGENIHINGNVISADDTTYTAGQNVQINNNVISATDTVYEAADDSVLVNNANHTIGINPDKYYDAETIDEMFSDVGQRVEEMHDTVGHIGDTMYAYVAPNHTIGYGAYELPFQGIERPGRYEPQQSGIFTVPYYGIYHVILQLNLQWQFTQRGHEIEYRIVRANDVAQLGRDNAFYGGILIARTYGGTSGGITSINKSFLAELQYGEGYYIMAKDTIASGSTGVTVLPDGGSWVQIAYVGEAQN